MEVSLYAELAAEFGFGDHEMPKPLIHVHRATEVAYRSESFDDLEDFFNLETFSTWKRCALCGSESVHGGRDLS
jgi:hypothetical protein